MRVLLVAGAGTSMELGVPGMAGLAEEFIEHSKQWEIEPQLVKQILESFLDVEHLIEELDRICTARRSLETLASESAASLDRFDKVRAEVEWFIQHAAERVVASDAHVMWGSLLRASSQVTLTLITTNYDRAIELAANAEGIRLDDGFGSFGDAETAPWVGFKHDASEITLVKLHGSTDWYAAGEAGSPTKLRHPMPLFGRAELRLPDGTELGSALVLPSREKLLTRDPYPRLSQTFLNAADNCELAIVVGSSLRDHHLRSAMRTIAQRVPLFVINPEGQTFGVDRATGITQSASQFLIGTLPNALMASDPAGILTSAAASLERGGSSILAAVKHALDSSEAAGIRCSALEQLDAQGIPLESSLMRQLLDSSDAHVARYALGLIPLSGARDSLLEDARNSVHANDLAYHEDLRLLCDIISR